MPQMAPMNWFMFYLIFTLIFYLFYIIIFFNLFEKNFCFLKKSVNFTNKIIWKW
uniref:ATP synthase F0 subunit 8 n=1 Tax=Xanthostigma gobicola TaxID=1593331 RepID=A0A1S5QYW2_9NEOP|nr:ATP synthase F0 subunit 8 [Xanthostigma gobicola]